MCIYFSENLSLQKIKGDSFTSFLTLRIQENNLRESCKEADQAKPSAIDFRRNLASKPNLASKIFIIKNLFFG